MSKFKEGQRVRVASLVMQDEQAGVAVGMVGTVGRSFDTITDTGCYVKIDGATLRDIGSNIEGDHYAFFDKQLELVPFEVPASPFYVSVRKLYSTDREIYKIDVDGLRYKATRVEGGVVMAAGGNFTRDIPGFLTSGHWQLTEPPTPAVDSVVAATAEVQRLLRELDEAKAACGAAQDVLDKAEENRRHIGRRIQEANWSLQKAMCEAAGVEYAP